LSRCRYNALSTQRKHETVPVVRHSLREFEQFRSQILGAGEADAEFTGTDFDLRGKIMEQPIPCIGWGRDLDLASGEVLAQCFERGRDPCTPSDFPLEPLADFGRFKTFNQGAAAARALPICRPGSPPISCLALRSRTSNMRSTV
jgi:hypothetical protein